MKNVFLFFLIILIIFFESVFTTIPLTFILLLNLLVSVKKEWVFILAFVCGLLLDVFKMRDLGTTTFFIIAVLFIVSMYEKKFETRSIYFVSIISFSGSLLFLSIFHHISILQSTFSTLISIAMFLIINKVKDKNILNYRGING